MSIEFITLMYGWGCNIKGYVGTAITKAEYKEITGTDYKA